MRIMHLAQIAHYDFVNLASLHSAHYGAIMMAQRNTNNRNGGNDDDEIF